VGGGGKLRRGRKEKAEGWDVSGRLSRGWEERAEGWEWAGG
jgi:hypothetical protein